MDSTGKASIEKDGENEKTPNVKDEEISAKMLENNKQPEKAAKKAVDNMTDTNAKMKVGGVEYPVYSFSSGDTTKYCINMGAYFNEVTDVTVSEEGDISVENAQIDSSMKTAKSFLKDLEGKNTEQNNLPILNKEEEQEAKNIAILLNKATEFHCFRSQAGRHKDINTQLKKITKDNIITFYDKYSEYCLETDSEDKNCNNFNLATIGICCESISEVYKSLVELALETGITENNKNIQTIKDIFKFEINNGFVSNNQRIHNNTNMGSAKVSPGKIIELNNAFKDLAEEIRTQC